MKDKILGLLAIILAVTPTYSFAETRNCASFETQQEAQAYYEARKKAGQTGWKNLDRDKDGKACDCNKGGSGKNCPKSK